MGSSPPSWRIRRLPDSRREHVVIFQSATIGVRRRSWRRTRRGRPPRREPGPHDKPGCTQRDLPTATTKLVHGFSSAELSVNFPHAPFRARHRQPFPCASLTSLAHGGTIATASTSLGEASAWIQATDLERRKTPRVRTALPGLRVEPKWLPAQPDTPCGAKALSRGVPRPVYVPDPQHPVCNV